MEMESSGAGCPLRRAPSAAREGTTQRTRESKAGLKPPIDPDPQLPESKAKGKVTTLNEEFRHLEMISD